MSTGVQGNDDLFVPRRVLEDVLGAVPRSFEEFFQRPAIILLGEPGIGKTRLLERASREENGQLVSARILNLVADDLDPDRPIYIDGLDEIRALTADGVTAIDGIIGVLRQLGRPKFRLSCRAADWFGEMDRQQARLASRDDSITQLSLLPLDQDDIRTVIVTKGLDPLPILQRAHDEGISEWLRNPQNLDLFLAAFADSEWPKTRTDLFEKGCRSLAEEQNAQHSRPGATATSPAQIRRASEHLCSIALLAGIEGFSLSRDAESPQFPFYLDLLQEEDESTAFSSALRCRLFRSAGVERVSPRHRTIAEYLGARHLVHRVQEGLPIGRALAILTKPDRQVPTELRGLFGWFVTLSGQQASHLLEIDPLGVALYGDLAELSVDARRRFFHLLRREAENDPFFRGKDWSQRPFSSLSSPELASELAEFLEDPSVPWQAQTVALDALARGKPLPELGDLLLQIIRDPARVEAVRDRAIEAFCRACGDRTEEMRSLLEDIQAGVIEDSSDQGRYLLLQALVPDVIDGRSVVDFIVPRHPEVISVFVYRYLNGQLLEQIPENQLPDFIEDLTQLDLPPHGSTNFRLQPLLADTLVRGLEELRHCTPPETLYRWCGIHLRKDGYTRSVLDGEHSNKLRNWFEAHPEIVRDLFRVAVSEVSAGDHMLIYNFEQRCPGALPDGFGFFLLGLATEQEEEEIADLLFNTMLNLIFRSHCTTEPTIEDVVRVVESHDRFSPVWERRRSTRLGQHHQAMAEIHAEQVQRQIARDNQEQKTIEHLRGRLLGIRQGADSGCLIWLAQKYYNFWLNHDLRSLSPIERITRSVDDDQQIVEAALSGFIATIRTIGAPTLRKLGLLAARQQTTGTILPICAGLDLIWSQAKLDEVGLSAQDLALAVVYRVAGSFGEDLEPEWVGEIATRHPEECARALVDYWRPSFEARCNAISQLQYLQEWPSIAKFAAIELLRSFPRAHYQALQELIRAGLNADHQAEILEIARSQFTKPRGLRVEQSMLWLATGFLISPDEFLLKLIDQATTATRPDTSRKRAGLIVEYLNTIASQENQASFPLTSLGQLLPTFCSIYPHFPIRKPGITASDDTYTVPKWIDSRLAEIAARVGNDARALLSELETDPHMAPWHDRIRNLLAERQRDSVDRSFRHPCLDQVIKTLRGGAPANGPDFLALGVDTLRSFAEEARHGSTDIDLDFWNVDQHGRAETPRPENSCSDRLATAMEAKLSPLGVSVERESQHHGARRSDLRLGHGQLSLPIECKRHYHKGLWTAIKDQLIPRYSRDPNADGYGLYVVFWFGLARDRGIPRPPSGIQSPTSSTELEEALRLTIPAEQLDRIEVICIDVSSAMRT